MDWLKAGCMTEEEKNEFTKDAEELKALYKKDLLRVPVPLSDEAIELFCNAFGKGLGQGYLYARKKFLKESP